MFLPRIPFVRLLVVFIIVIVITACGASLISMKPMEQDVNHLKESGLQSDIISLKKGYKLYLYSCSGCHNLHLPQKFTREQWDSVLPEMFMETELNKEDQELIRNYLFSKTD